MKSLFFVIVLLMGSVGFAETLTANNTKSSSFGEDVLSDEEFLDALLNEAALKDSGSLRGSGALAAGTCYQFSNCSGMSTHVFNKSTCPAGTRSFIADFQNFGCELYW